MGPSTPSPPGVLPHEIVEEILIYLDLNSIKSLRLSSRSFCERCTGYRFMQFCRVQSIELTQPSLRSLQELLGHPTLSTAVKDLEIVATVYDQTTPRMVIKAWKNKQENRSTQTMFSHNIYDPNQEDLSRAEATIAWLQAKQDFQDELSYNEAVKQLTLCLSQIRKLDRIELDAVIIQGPSQKVTTDTGDTNWYPVWMQASRTYCTTMEAITLSQLKLETLNIYQRTPRCSVPLYDIATHVEMLDANKSCYMGKHIDHLSLSISDKVSTGATDRPPRKPVTCHEVACYEKRNPRLIEVVSLGDDDSGGDERMDGLAQLLKFTPNLKALDIHFYTTKLAVADSILDPINRKAPMALLRKCKIGGITTSQDSLIQFLSNHPNITDLALCWIAIIPEGSWDHIFSLLERRVPGLTRLHLSYLKGGPTGTINLHPVWNDDPEELRVNRRSQLYYIPVKVFDADDISKGLNFRPMPDYPVQGSSDNAKRAHDSQREYGCPWLARGDS
ncbi:hypothetical protein N7481_001034 [Penicillium waksmanii]|uniref:uncharacterized protein n=1 Tax=Penicillium waksmanii TaxID=69791 RepID=UPI0025492A9E|nr:uncharacterized protein N7481_001034 [Penicillium waksmanii]KAJ6000625.1 hypothetical protein N7481_001034 [Penicillium waksmanii]